MQEIEQNKLSKNWKLYAVLETVARLINAAKAREWRRAIEKTRQAGSSGVIASSLSTSAQFKQIESTEQQSSWEQIADCKKKREKGG
jgi:hypothetical protein